MFDQGDQYKKTQYINKTDTGQNIHSTPAVSSQQSTVQDAASSSPPPPPPATRLGKPGRRRNRRRNQSLTASNSTTGKYLLTVDSTAQHSTIISNSAIDSQPTISHSSTQVLQQHPMESIAVDSTSILQLAIKLADYIQLLHQHPADPSAVDSHPQHNTIVSNSAIDSQPTISHSSTQILQQHPMESIAVDSTSSLHSSY